MAIPAPLAFGDRNLGLAKPTVTFGAARKQVLAPQAILRRFNALFGDAYVEPELFSTSELARDPSAPSLHRDWQEVDEFYQRPRNLFQLDNTITAWMLTERLGMPLIYAMAPPVVTEERNWSTLFRDIYQFGFTELGPTGIPHTTSWKSVTETGQVKRFGFHVELVSEMVDNDEFGPGLLRDAVKAIYINGVLTLVREVVTALSDRPRINFLNKYNNNLGRPPTHGEWYHEWTQHFASLAVDIDKVVLTLKKALTGNGQTRTRVMVPQPAAWAVSGCFTQLREIPYKAVQAADEAVGLNYAMLDAGQGKLPSMKMDHPEQPDVVFVAAPTIKVHTMQDDEEGDQRLLNRVVLARSVESYPKDFSAAKSCVGPAIQINVPWLTHNDAGWAKIPLAHAIQKTNGGYIWANLDSTTPSASMRAYIERLQANPAQWENIYRNEILVTPNLASPSTAVQSELTNRRYNAVQPISDIPFRSGHFFVHPVNDLLGDALIGVAFPQKIGQFTEAAISTPFLITIAECIARAGVGPVLANIIGQSEAFVQELRLDLLPGRPSRAGAATYRSQLIRYSQESTIPARPQVLAAQAGGGAQAPIPPIQNLLASLPNSSFTKLQPHVSRLEALKKDQPEKTAKLLEVIQAHVSKARLDDKVNEPLVALTMDRVIAHLQKAGVFAVDAAVPGAPLAQIDDALTRALGKLSIPARDIAEARWIGHDSDEWSMARDIRGRHGIGAVPFGVNEGVLGGDTTTNILNIDITRMEALENMTAELTDEQFFTLFFLFDLPNTPRMHARLANLGIQLLGVELMRIQEAYDAYTLIMATEDAAFTMVSRLRNYLSTGTLGKRLSIATVLSAGVAMQSPNSIDALWNVFPARVAGGVGANIMSNIEDVATAFMGRIPTTGDLMFVWVPETERRHDRPCPLLGLSPATDTSNGRRTAMTPQMLTRAHSGYRMLEHLLDQSTVQSARAAFSPEVAAEDMPNMGLCPYVERMPTYTFNEMTGQDTNKFDGTGPIGALYKNDPQTAKAIYNGKPGIFPQGPADTPQYSYYQ